MNTRKQILKPLLTLIIAINASLLIFLVNPAEPGHYPICPFKSVVHLNCPGCGTLRGLHETLHGHYYQAFRLNILSFIILPYLIWWWLAWCFKTQNKHLPTIKPSRFKITLLLSIIIVFWILRDLPFGAFLAP